MVNFTDPEFVADPYPAYADLRAGEPVHRCTLPDGADVWLVTRHADVRAGYADPRLVMTRPENTTWRGLSLPPAFGKTLGTADPPVHTRLRGLLTAAFTARRVAALRPVIQRLTDELLDPVVPDGRCDLVATLARPLPLRVFSELFGIPDADGAEFFDMAGVLFVPNSEQRERRAAAMTGLDAYLRDLIHRKQQVPGDDLLSALIRARDVEGTLTEDELTGMIAILMVAGSQTTMHLIANAVITLFREPGLAAELEQRPELLGPTVEEVLRHEGPVPLSTRRFAAEDLTIAGTRIARGDVVFLSIASAGRDETAHPDADRFCPDRAGGNRHLAFGHGIHRCVGAGLARLEGEIALETVVRRLPGLAPGVPLGRLRWQDNPNIRGVYELPVVWSSAT